MAESFQRDPTNNRRGRRRPGSAPRSSTLGMMKRSKRLGLGRYLLPAFPLDPVPLSGACGSRIILKSIDDLDDSIDRSNGLVYKEWVVG